MVQKKALHLATAIALLGFLQVASATPRDLPVPQTVSPQMQKIIGHKNLNDKIVLDTQDKWFNFIDVINEANVQDVKNALEYYKGVTLDEGTMAGVHTYTINPPKLAKDKEDKVILFFHGGGYVLNKGLSGTYEGICLAGKGGYKVIDADDRVAPEDPYPAAMDDAIAVYKELLKTYDPKNIGVFGSSTGGGMTLALVLMLKDQGLPLPGAIAAQTPWSDMAEIGDTYFTNRYTDNVLVTYDGWLDDAARVYANGHDLKDPYLSPVYGDYSNFPPTLLISGTRDLFLSNTVRVQEKLLKEDVEVSLIVYEGQSHVQYYSAPNVPEHHFHFENLTKFFEKYL